MKAIKLIFVFLALFSIHSFSQNVSLQNLEFLIGTWKVEGKESYESWKKKGDKLFGQAYKIKEGQKIVSENIELKTIENEIIYTPTVFDQNEGKGIPFKLISSENDLFSFENPQHDFPKKVQYRILNDHELHVSVLGENDEGFSFKMKKQTD